MKHTKVDATETSSGSLDEVVCCETCQEELSRNTIIIPREIVFKQRQVSLPQMVLKIPEGTVAIEEEAFTAGAVVKWSNDHIIAFKAK